MPDRIVTVDGDCRDLASVEHLLHALDGVLDGVLAEDEGYVASTHVVREPVARMVAVLSWSSSSPTEDEVAERVRVALPDAAVHAAVHAGTAALPAPVAGAVAEHRDRSAGRLARYPGRLRVEQRTTPAAVVADSCVDEVRGLAGVSVTPDSVLDLTGFARPTWREGRCVLLVQQAVDVLVPFEVREQRACCSHH
jgi:hypothetical protein